MIMTIMNMITINEFIALIDSWVISVLSKVEGPPRREDRVVG
jgi:hypothetical protein